jgi:hypothetical protein
VNPKADLTHIEETDAILKFNFPYDFKELYLNINGFKSFDWQEQMFTLWPLELIIEEFNSSEDQDFVGFCDFLPSNHHIGFRKSAAGIYKIYPSIKHSDTDPIATTFEEVINLINTNTGSIY